MTTTHPIKYRRDYRVPTHLIDSIDLTFELEEPETTVISRMHVRKNPLSLDKQNQLVLNGEDLLLSSVKVNGEVLHTKQYELDNTHLILKNIPEECDVEIETVIYPQDNTTLMGLYKSNQLFCTQCEAEGFRRITYYLDRPDVLARFTTTIIADKRKYPILLSNGNLVDSGNLTDGLHWMKWEDPFRKPCYLFAMVAGDLDFIEDYFRTQSGRLVTLRIFSEKENRDKCGYAMKALQKAMRWDEEFYGREYDLDTYMVVAVNDFNFGAMENKGLNIFNAKYVLADADTATDKDYEAIDNVIGHEYFHNWTGNRVTCRDWFQICLKEGLTMFRDHTFSETIGSAAVTRINQVRRLRQFQFPEDGGPLAHPIRPDSYMEINNFYTMTVYDKGSEVIRMLRTLLGKDGFRKGMDLYFENYDGQAVTCEDFLKAMEEACQVDLKQFRLWYSQAGTPELFVTSDYDKAKKEYSLMIKQVCPSTSGQSKKLPMQLPLTLGLLDAKGQEMKLSLKEGELKANVLIVKEPQETFVFENVKEKPVLSLLRDFSAPVKVHYDYTEDELIFLMQHDNDPFAQWEAAERYTLKVMLTLIQDFQRSSPLELPEKFIAAFKAILLNQVLDKAFMAEILILPSESYLADQMDVVDVDAIHVVREFVKARLAKVLQPDFLITYQNNILDKPYEFNVKDAGQRALKNICLGYLVATQDPVMNQLAMKQFESSDNMTDRFAALAVLSNVDSAERLKALESFYKRYEKEPLVIDKWFAVQAMSTLPDTLQAVIKLSEHPAFNIKNPNRVRSLLMTFALANPVYFHAISGEGYELLADYILRLNKMNPMMAAALVRPFTRWRRYNKKRQQLMKKQLERILAEPELAKDIYELVKKSV